MADSITIPSPSVFLKADSPKPASPPSQKPALKPKQPRKRASVAKAKATGKEEENSAPISKRKQSKSRNGVFGARDVFEVTKPRLFPLQVVLRVRPNG